MNDLLTYIISQSGGASEAGCQQALLAFPIIFGIFYFFMIRPQLKEEKERQAELQRLKVGDPVITSGGIIGKIHSLKGQETMVEVASKVRIRVAQEDIYPYQSPSQNQEQKTEND